MCPIDKFGLLCANRRGSVANRLASLLAGPCSRLQPLVVRREAPKSKAEQYADYLGRAASSTTGYYQVFLISYLLLQPNLFDNKIWGGYMPL